MKLLVKCISVAVAAMYEKASKGHAGDAGLDIFFPEAVTVPAKAEGMMIGLGIQCEPVYTWCSYKNAKRLKLKGPPPAYELWPRSSVGKTPIRLANSIGLIDPGYRGEIKVMVDNISDEPFLIEKGTRLFQLVAADRRPIEIMITEELSETTRGHGGHGSTGK